MRNTGTLGIHIIGEEYGESIVLEFPTGKVGVIDCFTRVLKTKQPQSFNPTLRFLRDDLGIERLEFVALTHPHEDHGRGISHLLDEYDGEIAEYWMFDAFMNVRLLKFFEEVSKSDSPLPIEALLDETPGTFREELVQIIQKVCEDAIEKETVTLRRFREYRALDIDGEPVRCHFLGPGEFVASTYECDITQSLTHVRDPEWEPDKLNHNLASPALLFEYGETRVLLCADVEKEAWRFVLSEQDESERDEHPSRWRPPLSAHLVKVSHHGSKTGYVDGLYQRFRDEAAPLAVLTTYRRGGNSLPDVDALTHIRPQVSELLTTDLATARESLQRKVAASPPEIPPDWISQLLEDPNRVGLLNSAAIDGGGEAEGRVELPPPWIQSIIRNPENVSLLNPSVVRRPMGGKRGAVEAPEVSCRVSIFFNDKGMELADRRYLGAAAGGL